MSFFLAVFLAMAQGRRLQGEPEKLIARALTRAERVAGTGLENPGNQSQGYDEQHGGNDALDGAHRDLGQIALAQDRAQKSGYNGGAEHSIVEFGSVLQDQA